MISKLDFYCFSPTGGTQSAGKTLARALSSEINFHDLMDKNKLPASPDGELSLIAAPVFGGRIPPAACEKIKVLDGFGKNAVVMAVYGTRAVEDALLELKDVAEEAGFQVVAAGAFVARHSVVTDVGPGRPDEKDARDLHDFATKILAKLASPSSSADLSLQTKLPGSSPYKPAFAAPAAPLQLPTCTGCGTCISLCPASAISTISEDNIPVTDKEKCMLCMACIYKCSSGARILPLPFMELMEQRLGQFKEIRRENETYL